MDPALLPIIPLIIIGALFIIIAVAIINNSKRDAKMKKQYQSIGGRYRYVPGQFSEQMELDLRLPYRRFRQLYPDSRWTYQEYKKIQMQRAFRRSTSSQDNQRMVR